MSERSAQNQFPYTFVNLSVDIKYHNRDMMQSLARQIPGRDKESKMYQVTVVKGDYSALAQSGTRTGQVIGCYADKSQADLLAAEMADCGIKCRVSIYKMTTAEAKRAAMLASFGQTYVPKHVEPAGKWVRA